MPNAGLRKGKFFKPLTCFVGAKGIQKLIRRQLIHASPVFEVLMPPARADAGMCPVQMLNISLYQSKGLFRPIGRTGIHEEANAEALICVFALITGCVMFGKLDKAIRLMGMISSRK